MFGDNIGCIYDIWCKVDTHISKHVVEFTSKFFFFFSTLCSYGKKPQYFLASWNPKETRYPIWCKYKRSIKTNYQIWCVFLILESIESLSHVQNYRIWTKTQNQKLLIALQKQPTLGPLTHLEKNIMTGTVCAKIRLKSLNFIRFVGLDISSVKWLRAGWDYCEEVHHRSRFLETWSNMIGYEMGSAVARVNTSAETSSLKNFKHAWKNDTTVQMTRLFVGGILQKLCFLDNHKKLGL
jgi:hypothetical protein